MARSLMRDSTQNCIARKVKWRLTEALQPASITLVAGVFICRADLNLMNNAAERFRLGASKRDQAIDGVFKIRYKLQAGQQKRFSRRGGLPSSSSARRFHDPLPVGIPADGGEQGGIRQAGGFSPSNGRLCMLTRSLIAWSSNWRSVRSFRQVGVD